MNADAVFSGWANRWRLSLSRELTHGGAGGARRYIGLSGEENNGGDAMRRNVLLLDQRTLLILLPCLFFPAKNRWTKAMEKNSRKKFIGLTVKEKKKKRNFRDP